jgi:phosphomevalonate kinase
MNPFEHYMLPLIIAVSGKLGSGKDYIMQHVLPLYLAEDLNIIQMAFADHLKVDVAVKHNIDISSLLSGRKSKENRRLLQYNGQIYRENYEQDVWVKVLENWICLRQSRGEKIDVVLITDCRYPNEVAWVQGNNGLFIKIIAVERVKTALNYESAGNTDTYNAIANHQSETALDDYDTENVLYNDPSDTDTVNTQLVTIINRYLNGNINNSHLFSIY